MLWRRVGNDAVAEIEHERRVPQQIENFAHPPLKMRSAGKQEERIEVARFAFAREPRPNSLRSSKGLRHRLAHEPGRRVRS